MSKSEQTKPPNPQGPMRKVLGNFGFLIRGRGIAGILLFGVTALMARTLGAAEFGFVVLIQTYVLLLRGLFEFQIFDVIVRYGIPAQENDDRKKIRRLFKICWKVDRSARIIATLIGLLLAPVIGPAMGMDQEQTVLLALYTLVLLSTVGEGTAIGVLRLYNQFDILGKQMAVGPFIRLIGVIFAWWYHAPMSVFVSIFALAFVSEHVYLDWYAWKEYQKHLSFTDEIDRPVKVKFDEFSGLKHFLWVTYWQANADLVSKHISVILAGYLLGPVEAGLLRLARQFSSLLAKPAELIRQVVFPDLTRSWREGSDHFKLVAYRTALLGIGIGFTFVVTGYFYGDIILEKLVGEEYMAAAPLLTLLLLAASFDLSASSLRAAAYAIGSATQVLHLYVISVVVYLGLFFLLTVHLGLIGAGIAACIAAIIPLIAMIIMIHKSSLKTVEK